MKNDWFDRFIFVKENALDSDFCKSVIQKFENDSRLLPGRVGEGRTNDKMKKSTDLYISRFDDWQSEDKVFYDSLGSGFSEYVEYIRTFFDIDSMELGLLDNGLSDSGYQVQRTNPGEFYHWHHDSFYENTQGRGNRVITYIWYLNDVEDDGQTEFINERKVQPKEGTLLIFPSLWTYVHRGVSPKHTTKYICTGWMYSGGIGPLV